MGEPRSPDLRVGDAEREEALRALGEHMSVGRLDVDEYGERSARASAAKTRGELIQLFADLPEPHPKFGGKAGRALRQPEAGGDVTGRRQRAGSSQFASALVPLSGLLALVLFFTVDGMSWVIFLLPAAVAIIIGAIQGDQRKRHKHRPR